MKIEEIHQTFVSYLEAYYTQRFDDVYSMLYDQDVQLFYAKTLEIAERMDELGEATLFLKRLKINSIDQLKSMTVKEFVLSILKLTQTEIGEKELKRIIKETKIIDVEEATFLSIVHYEYPIKLYDEWQVVSGKVEMIHSEGNWKLLFKSGMENGFDRFHYEIDRFYQLKAKDAPTNLRHEGDLTKFTITGYKDCVTGKIVIEPRFKYAGEFSEGLAPVQIIKNYGYINVKGELAIKPQFVYASGFFEKRASVLVEFEDKTEKWGFIDTKGKMVIEPMYENARSFSDGLCAVQLNEKWGFINKKGELVIEFSFDVVDDFSYGTATVEIYNEEGDSTSFLIDKKGKITDIN